jgi:hypothetical protein
MPLTGKTPGSALAPKSPIRAQLGTTRITTPRCGMAGPKSPAIPSTYSAPIRSLGTQNVVVQHVNVEAGSLAVVGNVDARRPNT